MARMFCREKEEREREGARRKNRRKLKLLAIRGVISAGIVYCTVYGILYHYVGKLPKDRIFHNIYIGGTEVSGMTADEAEKALLSRLEKDVGKKVVMTVDGSTAEATLEELGLRYQDIGRTVQKAGSYAKTGNIWSRCWKIRRLAKEKVVLGENLVLDHGKAEEIMKERAVPLTDHAEDAQISHEEGQFRITPEKEGRTIDIKGSVSEIERILNEDWSRGDIAVTMKQKTEEPAVTADQLKLIQDELGTFSTDAGGGRRWQNLKTGADRLDGSILMPGQELSVYGRTAPYDADHGYVEAGAYENGRVVDSYGGGICQVSTTLYNAALAAELEIVERYPHSMLVSYVEAARDAAIAGDYLDLVLRNPYDVPVYIEGGIDDENQLRFTVYGKESRDGARRVEFRSEILTVEEYEVVYRENSKMPLGSVECVSDPHTGKTAQLWKIIYQDGQETGKEKVNNSKYDKTDKIIEIGTDTADQRAADYVREAIESQEWEKIEAALHAVTEQELPEQE